MNVRTAHARAQTTSALESSPFFVLGAVAFEICPSPGLDFELSAEHALFRGAYSTSPIAGHVHCVVSPSPELEESVERKVSCRWEGELAHVSTGRARAELRQLGPGRYAASAFVVPDESGCSALVTALTAAIVEREGGLVLHAAGVELDGRAALFIGPSGAGKTTTANHCRELRWMARDRAVVYRTPLGWYAAGMPGGDPIDLPRSHGRVFPLGGICRIVKNTVGPRVLRLEGARAVFKLRECVQSSAGIDEADALERVEAFAREARICELETMIGVDPTAALRAGLER